MSSVDLVINLRGLDPFKRTLGRMSPQRLERLLDSVGATLESQTRERLGDDKKDPEGKPWAPWSPDYAERRPSNGGLLELSGGLIDSIAFETSASAVTLGSNLVYALSHQMGDSDRGIPARPYLGVSDENLEDIGDVVMRFIAREMWA